MLNLVRYNLIKALWALEKFWEIPKKHFTLFAVWAVITGAGLLWAVSFVRSNYDLVAPYLILL